MIRGKEIISIFAIPFRTISKGLFAGSNPESFTGVDEGEVQVGTLLSKTLTFSTSPAGG
jgi:hypothetical protein